MSTGFLIMVMYVELLVSPIKSLICPYLNLKKKCFYMWLTLIIFIQYSFELGTHTLNTYNCVRLPRKVDLVKAESSFQAGLPQ